MTRDDEFDPEPPRALDDSILKQAREALESTRRKPRTARWAVPAALAATILLCLSVVLNVSLRPRPEPTRSLEAARDAAPPPVPAAAPPAAARATLPAAPAALAKRRAEVSAVDAPPPDPKAWLARIESLRAAGRTAEADAEMSRFRAAFPDYPAPK